MSLGKECNMSIYREINRDLSQEDIRMLNPLVLAFIGDGIYELLVRTWILKRGLSPHKLHRYTARYVKAKGQAEFFERIKEELTDEELGVIRRGRNVQSHTMPKNATVADYRLATGVEALFGFLYLNRKDERMVELFNLGMEENHES